MKKALKLIFPLGIIVCAIGLFMSVELPGGLKPGDPLPNLTASDLALFNDGKTAFEDQEQVSNGIGPIFNNNACVNCHNATATGGGSAVFEIRFGRNVNGVFDPLINLGGSQLQFNSIQGVNVNGMRCFFATEQVPPQANVTAKRRTIPLFGLGLVDVLPDQVFKNLAANQPASIRGKVAMVVNADTGQLAVGRFGWKAQNATIHEFSGDAYVNEMGVTNPSFPQENCPNAPPNCPQVLTCDPVPGLDDDGADVTAFTNFIRFLAPIGRGVVGSREMAGEKLFNQLGCAACHVPTLQTPNDPGIPQGLRNITFHPYSDFLIHNMGTLGDGIAQGGAGTLEMRTQPLWGLRFENPLTHDERVADVRSAIQVHDGQGAAARNAFNALPSTQQEDLLAFLRSL